MTDLVKQLEDKKKKGKCPVCKAETTYSKIYGFYCGCQGLGGTEEYDTESGY